YLPLPRRLRPRPRVARVLAGQARKTLATHGAGILGVRHLRVADLPAVVDRRPDQHAGISVATAVPGLALVPSARISTSTWQPIHPVRLRCSSVTYVK